MVTRKQIVKAKEEQETATIEAETRVRKRKREWYEKYHWLVTTNGFLVIGGRDIRSNEEIVKRRMSTDDYFFHADLRGAPYVVLNVSSQPTSPSSEDIEEAASMAACYSRAWTAKRGSADVYYVKGSQTSFSAPSGEFLPKGGIMVRGQRTYLRGVPIRLAIGLKISDDWAQIIGGTKSAIKETTNIYALIVPGDIPKGKLGKQIMSFFQKTVEPANLAKVKAIDLNEMISFLPGDSQILETHSSTMKDLI